jgi:hypothetical protein
VVSLRQDFKAVKPVITVALITFLKDWLSKHIKRMDQKYEPLMINKGALVSLLWRLSKTNLSTMIIETNHYTTEGLD